MPKLWYLSCRVEHLTEAEAQERAAKGKAILAREYADDSGWYVLHLFDTPIQHGQAPVILTPSEQAALA